MNGVYCWMCQRNQYVDDKGRCTCCGEKIEVKEDDSDYDAGFLNNWGDS